MDWCTTDDIQGDTWRRVLEYANVDLALDVIEERHGSPTSKSLRANYKKQALQIRVSILQAREYFQAAENSTSFTAPNHLYYGLSSLASALMLLRGTGDKALDRLRENADNAHHGLKFSTGIQAKLAATGTALFDGSHVEVLRHGHFMNWYSELPRRMPSFVTVHREGRGVRRTSMEVAGATRVRFGSIIGRKTSLIDLICYLPDLESTLTRYLISVTSSRATHEITYEEEGATIHSWTLHGAGDNATLLAILAGFRFPSELHEAISIVNEDIDDSIIFSVTVPRGSKVRFRVPSSRWTADYQHLVYGTPLEHEFVDMYRLCFGLSMLARYFPDLWISCLDSHCRAAKLVDAATAVILRKAPLLAIGLICGHPIVVNTQRPLWHG